MTQMLGTFSSNVVFVFHMSNSRFLDIFTSPSSKLPFANKLICCLFRGQFEKFRIETIETYLQRENEWHFIEIKVSIELHQLNKFSNITRNWFYRASKMNYHFLLFFTKWLICYLNRRWNMKKNDNGVTTMTILR